MFATKAQLLLLSSKQQQHDKGRNLNLRIELDENDNFTQMV